MPRHFLDIGGCEALDLTTILAKAKAMKAGRAGLPRGAREPSESLKGRILAMIFERPSTRTRVSFDVAMRQLGGETLVISSTDMQLGRGETIADTARVLSRYVDAIMLRAARHTSLSELAAHSGVPVINGLTDRSHPCQVMADVLTLEEHVGPLARQTVAWVGDGNNVAASWIEAAGKLGGKLRFGCPPGFQPPADLVAWARGQGAAIELLPTAEQAVEGASCVLTDAWVSMHDNDAGNRHKVLAPFQVNARLMGLAAKGAKFMHCLPAHRGEEVTDEVMDGPHSLVFEEAENRVHVQKAILLYIFGHD